MKEANKARLQKILQKKYRTKEGIKTYEEIINYKLEKGDNFFIFEEDDSSKREKILTEMQKLKKNWIIAESKEKQQNGKGSNYYIPQVTKYWELFDELHDGCKKNIYLLGQGTIGIQIPKMVYDFYNNQNK